jgi:WD40 repeat protein
VANVSSTWSVRVKTSLLLLAAAITICGCEQGRQTPKGSAAGAGTTPPANARVAQPHIPTTATFSPDGRQLVTTSPNGGARIWDARTGQPLPGQIASNPGRYQPDNPDHMPMVGRDQLQVLQDQIDALQRRIQALEEKQGVTKGR